MKVNSSRHEIHFKKVAQQKMTRQENQKHILNLFGHMPA